MSAGGAASSSSVARPSHLQGTTGLATDGTGKREPQLAERGGGPPTQAVADLLPLKGFLLLSRPHDSDCAFVIHSLTLEKSPLPPGQWSLQWDEEGFAALIDESGNDREPLLAEDILRRRLFRTLDGELVVSELSQGEHSRRQWSLSTRLQESESIQVSFPVGPLREDIHIQAVYLRWPRSGMHHWWSMKCVYGLLKLTCFKGVASKWVYESAKGWKGWFAQLLGSEAMHFMPSRLSAMGGSTSECLVPMPCLDWPAASTLGLILLLCRWSGCAPRSGGLRDREAAFAARALLEGLVAACCSVKPFFIDIRALLVFPWGNLGLVGQRIVEARRCLFGLPYRETPLYVCVFGNRREHAPF